jgi:hypothetical protein
MTVMKSNDMAKPDDFRRAAEARRAESQAVEQVVLPKSGFHVALRRPALMWFLFHGRLPVSLAARQSLEGGNSKCIETADEFVEFSNWVVDLLREVFVTPRLALNPREGEISPEWLAEEDLNFIIRWAVGEVASAGGNGSSGHDLAEFRAKAPGPDSSARAGGGTVSLPPQPVAQGDGNGFSD